MRLSIRIMIFSLICSVPALILVWRLSTDNLGANPVEFLEHTSGDWTIYFLLLTLSISPIHQKFKPNWNRYLMPMHLVRRILGLSAFAYALIHLSVYFVFDMSLSIDEAINDIIERPFILIGMLAFLLLVPLAITSTSGWQRRLKKQWQTLHKAIYGLTFLGILHYAMLVKADMLEPIFYMLIFAALMLFRMKRFQT